VTEQSIFCAALAIEDRTARAAYLDKVCVADADLRRQVESLLAAHERSGEFLDVPAGEQIAEGRLPHGESTWQVHAGHDGDGIVAANKDHSEPDVTEAEPCPGGEEKEFGFLQRSSKPGSLGRLGHYEVLQVLGQGGFGVVLRAFDEVLQRVVAIKVMAPHLATTSPARKRFLREARSAGAVRHENVVGIYAVEEQPIPYLVMEYIAGETLQQRLDRTGPLDTPEVLRLGRQIVAGLAAAHAQGLIHRDIKPSNILLERGIEERIKITDFGLARAADDASLTQSGVVAGTPMYMSPEQAQGESIDQRADLFSLGSVLYAMCTGRPPFRASTTLAVLKRVSEDHPRPIREIIPEVPDWLCNIIAGLHAKRPEDRFTSAQDVADLLTRCLAEMQEHGTVTRVEAHPKTAATQSIHSASAPAAAHRQQVTIPSRRYAIAAALALALVVGAVAMYCWPRGGNDGATANPPPTRPPVDAAQAKADQETCAKQLAVAVEFENSIGMKLALIPPGSFAMGSPHDEPGRDSSEGPQHEVVLTKAFFMGIHDVTVGQFKAFVQEKGNFPEPKSGAFRLFPNGNWAYDPNANWRNPGYELTDDHPLVCVNWNEAKAFCQWLSAKEDRTYALPSEAQWEYACRAGSRTKFYFGDDDQELDQHAWYRANSELKAHPVGQKKPNAWGLYDMLGNVSRWTADWYPADYSPSRAVDPPGNRTGMFPVRRGGNWLDGAEHCRSAYRRLVAGPPTTRAAHVGFRVVLPGELKTAPPSKKSPESTGKK